MTKTISIAQKYGFITGLITILYFLLFYFWDKQLLNPEVIIGSYFIYIAAMLMGALALRSVNGGKLSFQEGLRTCFVIFLLANLCYYVFYYFIMNYDPELVEIQNNLMKNFSESLNIPGRTAEEIQQAQGEAFSLSLGVIFFSYAKGGIGGFMLSLLLTYLVKRE